MNKPFPVREDYKIVLRHANGWQDFKSARLQVSVPPTPTYDPRTRAVIDWAVRNFEQVTLCLHDSIQRYNLIATGTPEADAEVIAIQKGDAWLKENISPSDVFIDVVRWQAIAGNQDFPATHQRVLALYQSDEMGFAEAIDHDVEVFADRCRKRGEEFTNERIDLSRAFLLEEVAGYIPLFQSTGAVDIHTGMRMKAMQIVMNGAGKFDLQKNLLVAAKTYQHVPGAKPSALPNLKIA